MVCHLYWGRYVDIILKFLANFSPRSQNARGDFDRGFFVLEISIKSMSKGIEYSLRRMLSEISTPSINDIPELFPYRRQIADFFGE